MDLRLSVVSVSVYSTRGGTSGYTRRGEFKAEAGRQYPAYSGQNYLDMTAGFFFT